MQNWSYTAYRLIWGALDPLFPPECGGCGKMGSCRFLNCRKNIKIQKENLSEMCGLPLEKAGVCTVCQLDRPHFCALRAWPVFDNPVRNGVRKLKNKRNISMRYALAVQMKPFVRDFRLAD